VIQKINFHLSPCVVISGNYSRDVVLGLGPWSLVVLKDKIAVLGPGLVLEGLVLGPGLGLAC